MSKYRFNYFAFRIENSNFQLLLAASAMKPPILQIIHIFEGENVEKSKCRFNYFEFLLENPNLQQLRATPAMKPPIIQIIHIFEGENVEIFILLLRISLPSTSKKRYPTSAAIFWSKCGDSEIWWWVIWGWIFHESGTNAKPRCEDTKKNRFPTSTTIFWIECADSEIWWGAIWVWMFRETGTNVKPRGEDTKRKRFSMTTAIFSLEGADFEIWLEIVERKMLLIQYDCITLTSELPNKNPFTG